MPLYGFEPQSATAVSGRAANIQPLHSIQSRESWENDVVVKNGVFWTKEKKDMTVRSIKKGKNGVKGKQVLGGR